MPNEKPPLIVVAEGLNVREAPSLQGKVIEILGQGAQVEWDSTSGDGYWFRVRTAKKIGWAARKYLRWALEADIGSDYPWFPIAHAEVGVHEVVGSGDNPRIVEYLRSTTLAAPEVSNDETPWCSAFVNWCVEKAGHAGTDSAWARSWLNWGKKTTNPSPGCVAVFRREVNSGHVAFFVGESNKGIRVLGGNQGNAVNISVYPTGRLLGFRVPG